jgi:hypothetical protein
MKKSIYAASTAAEIFSKDRKVNNAKRFAINATLLALGLALSGAQAVASDVAEPTIETESEAKFGTPDQHSRESAKAANEAAVNDAVISVIEATRLDLDIRLIGRTSITVAAGK